MIVIYEDSDFIAFLAERPNSAGHTIIQPKKKITILEQMPDTLAGKLFYLANQLSSVLFDTLGIEGTNIIIENGTGAGQKIPQLQVHIVPRKQGDGLKLNWEQQKLEKDEQDILIIKLQKAMGGKAVSKEEKVIEQKEEVKENTQEFYRLA